MIRFSAAGILPVFVGLGLAACTTVNVHGDAGISRSSWFSPLRIDMAGVQSYRVAAIEGFGIVPGVHGASVGYKREILLWSSTPNDCRAIFIINDKEQIQALAEYLHQANLSLAQLCTLKLGK